MKVSLNLIREYVSLPAELSPEQLAYDLTVRTVEVEAAVNPSESLKNVVIGQIISVSPHPNADKLRVVQCNIGRGEPSQIVCGGSNLEPEQWVVIARPGSFVRWHGEGEPVEIKASKLRGVESEGMICAAGEVMLDELFPAPDDHVIMDMAAFADRCYAGQPLAELLGLDDLILEIDNKSLTNRPDLYCHYGLARELASIYRCPLKELPQLELPQNLPTYPVAIEDEKLCRRYFGLVYEGLEVKPSPFDLQILLWKLGQRPINNLVDLTNYVMLLTGQPTHGFDFSHVPNGILVRSAKENEKLVLLDEQELKLRPSDLVITDGKEPIALAGIMGGAKDSILPETKTMVLEIANFAGRSVRKSCQHFGLRTEASIRFEKNLDTQRCDQAMAVSHEMLMKLCPNAKLSAHGVAAPVQTSPNRVEIALDFLSSRLGLKIDAAEFEKLTAPLGLKVLSVENSVLSVEIPSWRSTGDISLPEDLVEECGRMIGYDHFAFIPPTVTLTTALRQPKYELERRVREYCAFRLGMQEIFTYPWVDESLLRAAGQNPEELLSLSAPPAPELAHLRSSLIPGLLGALELNLHNFENVKIFEMTQVFDPKNTQSFDGEEVLPKQQKFLAAALSGLPNLAMITFMMAKAMVEQMPRLVQCEPLYFKRDVQPAWADKKAWLNICSADGEIIGYLAVLSAKAAADAGIKRHSPVLFELNMDKLVPLRSRTNTYTPLPQYPLVEQDLSIIVDAEVAWADIETTIRPLVRNLQFLEEYFGAQVPEGKKSLFFRLHIGSDEGTLTSEEIESKMQSLIKKLKKRFGAELRN